MDKDQVRKIIIGAMLAIGGTLITYAINTVVPFLNDHGTWGPVVAAAAAIFLNAARKWIESVSKKHNGGESNGTP